MCKVLPQSDSWECVCASCMVCGSDSWECVYTVCVECWCTPCLICLIDDDDRDYLEKAIKPKGPND